MLVQCDQERCNYFASQKQLPSRWLDGGYPLVWCQKQQSEMVLKLFNKQKTIYSV